jgi:murein DD-endopeptidase MepM/ murein hydrolase activator NlpD
MSWRWPLLTKALWPDAPGQFGTVRKFDRHTGIDLYGEEGAVVVAVEDGVVVAVEDFTGEKVGSPWWNDTQSVLVEGQSGVVLYGELEVEVELGQKIEAGQRVGRIKRVLKQEKGRPVCMLHLELYRPGTRGSVWWHQEKPEALLDPTELLWEAAEAPDLYKCPERA